MPCGGSPQVSVLSYQTDGKGQAPETVYLLVEPADPLVEAARWLWSGALNCGSLTWIRTATRDIATICPIPTASTVSAWKPITGNIYGSDGDGEPCREDRLREQGMAFRLQELAGRHERILLVCGMAHLRRISGLFGLPQAAPLERIRRKGGERLEPAPGFLP